MGGEVREVDGVPYAHSNGYLHTLDARTGEPIWSVEIGSYFSGRGEPYLVSMGCWAVWALCWQVNPRLLSQTSMGAPRQQIRGEAEGSALGSAQ